MLFRRSTLSCFRNEFHFRYAQVAFAAARTQTAIASLNHYLVAVGRAGEFYREALELLDSAEARLEREDAERTRDARWPPGYVFQECEVCPEMVVMPGSLLALGRYEVTVAEYRAFASSTGTGPRDCRGGGSWRDPGYPQTDRHPVVCVNWFDAREYLSWLSRTTAATYRLPTEEEWARAAASSVLYGNAAGGVISLVTEIDPTRRLTITFAGPGDLRRVHPRRRGTVVGRAMLSVVGVPPFV